MQKTLIALLALVTLIWAGTQSVLAQNGPLRPYKDELFQYPRVTNSFFGGDFIVVEYSKKRDLQDRDKVDEREVYGRYVSYEPKGSQEDRELKANGRTVRYMSVGKAEGGASAVVIYVHGQGGNRFQGMNDVTFGGNFNRIKNLMVRNGGAYLSADITDFGEKGTADIAALIQAQKQKSPRARVVVACGSMGGILCWNLVSRPRTARMLDGILLLGAPMDKRFFSTGTFQSKASQVPIYIGHGSNDKVYNWEKQAEFFQSLHESQARYPVKFTLFDTGSHGTPIRMTDWRLVLNWMLSM